MQGFSELVSRCLHLSTFMWSGECRGCSSCLSSCGVCGRCVRPWLHFLLFMLCRCGRGQPKVSEASFLLFRGICSSASYAAKVLFRFSFNSWGLCMKVRIRDAVGVHFFDQNTCKLIAIQPILRDSAQGSGSPTESLRIVIFLGFLVFFLVFLLEESRKTKKLVF